MVRAGPNTTLPFVVHSGVKLFTVIAFHSLSPLPLGGVYVDFACSELQIILKSIQLCIPLTEKHSEFKKRPQITDALPYDFKSVMHYRNKVFSNNGQDTISALNDPGVVLGKKHDLSALDIVRVNKLYSCSDHLSRDRT